MSVLQIIGVETVEGMSGLMNQCLNILMHADGIHMDERLAGHRVVTAPSARSLALPVLQIQLLSSEFPVKRTKLRIHLLKDLLTDFF
jgi:hypothetical protein